ncbi:acyl carrier protein [Paenibacillus sp. MER 180]|uniref:acyl carrier protein n=1 Tax=unclassified Paenibacillus TaxID=185978 RepID=UPI0008065455|nr:MULTISPECIES: acyl carrier protein [unclassified Paenibacillus]MCM3290558.1 acyl carrier protein [Paenibacillus sp. MER 180]OBY80239.1 acyl carrier protein [Paenibacillus sp. KS1]
MNYQNEIRNFIHQNLSISEDNIEFSDDDNFFKLGFVNSLFAMKLVNFVEQKFGIEVENEDMDLKNFSTVNNLLALIHKKVNV